jgi:DNA mismatch repair ATPase MutS
VYFKTLAVAPVVYAFHLLIWAALNRKTAPVLASFEKNGGAFMPFSRLLDTMEQQSFSAARLRRLHEQLYTGQKSSGPLKDLASVISSIEVRHSPMGHFIANTVWLWDIQCVIRAERWKRAFGKKLRGWLLTAGEIEALSALSIIHFEHPQWAFPTMQDTPVHIEARQLGHPLLPDQHRVCNDIGLDQKNAVAIITGSNMSGKSTFLRTVGFNLVLGYAGAPVCAESMHCSLLDVYTSMRIGDNLRANISTFYAELLRIKKIVDAVGQKKQVLFLLDELFRGTNSQDRHDGAVAVIEALKTDHTLGIVSTHDLQLSELGEKQDAGFCNCHFKEYYVDKQIRYDYILYPGPSTTQNAMFLIQSIGIPVK